MMPIAMNRLRTSLRAWPAVTSAALKLCAVTLLTWSVSATRASAQFEQYTPPGSFEETRESMEELLNRSMKEARWRWGRVFLHPWLGLRDLSYVDPVTDRDGVTGSDVTASIGAGIRAYAPIGRELTLTAHALPEYVWWQDLSERRRVNGRYGAGLFGNLGRTGLEITASRTDDGRYVSSEIEEQINTREELGRLALEVDVGRGLSIFGEGSVRRLRFVDDAEIEGLPGLGSLERDEEIRRVGFRLPLPRGLTLGLGVEISEIDFTENDDRSHSGTSPIVELDYEGSPFYFAIHLALRDLEPEPDSRFVAYDDVTGDLETSWKLSDKTDLQLFGYRNLVYSAEVPWEYFEETSLGLGARIALRSQMSLRLYAEQGDSAYVSFEPASPERNDDHNTFGGQLQIGLGRVTLTLDASTTDYDSNFPDRDRTTTTIRSGLTLGSRSGSPWG